MLLTAASFEARAFAMVIDLKTKKAPIANNRIPTTSKVTNKATLDVFAFIKKSK